MSGAGFFFSTFFLRESAGTNPTMSPANVSIHLSIHLSIYPCIYPSIHPFIYLSIYLSIYLTMSPAKILIFAATSGPIISTILATAFSLDVEHTATVLPASSSSVTCHVYMDTY